MWKLLLYINSIRCTPRNRCLLLPFKISNYCIMVRQAIYNCGCLDVFARGASYYDVEPMALYVLGNLHVVLCQMMLECH